MALLAMLSVPALAQCPAPGALATVAYSEGAIPLSSSTSGSFPWLAAQGTELFPPGGSDTWLKCAQWWSLGPDRQVNAGESVGVQCDTEVCDVYAFLYHEPPRSSGTNGDLPAILPPAGWTPGSCAPTFTDPSSGIHCKMTAFRKQLLDAETTTIDIAAGQPAMYLVVVVAPGVKCDSNLLNSQGDCEAPEPFLAKSCAWEGGSCVDKWCKKTPPVGPPGVPPPQCSAPLDGVGGGAAGAPVVVYSTGVDDSGAALLLNTPDTHWEVSTNSGPWVQPLYAHTNQWGDGTQVDHPWLTLWGPEGPCPTQSPWPTLTTGSLRGSRRLPRTGCSAGGRLSTFPRVPWGRTASSTGWAGTTCPWVFTSMRLATTVWVNGAPQVKP
eukprot:Hpha_TRINITY_DN15870_c3_g3::TRINITY_DN15870_c3_g3_i4::g.187437::m.187437